MIKTKLLPIFIFLFIAQFVFSQSEIDKIIKAQAEEMAKATIAGDYEVLMEYTHPNIIEFSGGKENFLKVMIPQMEKMAEDGFIIESVEIGNPIATELYKGEYQTLVPKTMTMTVNGQKVISKDYLFGFSDSEGKKWTFTEAQKLTTERTKLIFPDFETNIEIPVKAPPLIVDEEGSVEVLEIDENEGTYQNTDEMVDTVFGIIGLGVGLVFLLMVAAAMIFLFIYFRRKKKKETDDHIVQKPVIKKVEKKTCSECKEENSPEAKYCAFCGYALPS